ncbi:MAG: spermidine synthase [Desulfomicrobiaceae bacterium]|jgi:spermidine synthase|nr:polyamine aminopropyltransferase [Desulfomicrobiaceae bacterium]MBZ4648807.1 polyamine aminopropyltransferase [Desulfomicrobiaceae bacterium]MDI3493824.1 spermidine synthase [Desulfomicrobiaceae bacterium]MDK2873913.1 spermidine synthase [Desulfomicrobiaceae bacterium]
MNNPPEFLVELVTQSHGYFIQAGSLVMQGKTQFQKIAIFDTPALGRVLCLDDVFMTSEKDEFFYHENLIHPAAITHPAPRQALVIGGGDGGAAEELLKHAGMERVVLAELDNGVIEACRRYLPAIHGGVFDDPRLHLAIGDGRKLVETTKDSFDLIALDLTDPRGPSQALYTHEFYSACSRRLTPHGLLSLHVESPLSSPQVYARIIATLRSVFPIVRPYLVYIPLYGTWWGMATASHQQDPLTLTPEEVRRRIRDRGLTALQFYNEATHHAVFALPGFVQNILASPAPPFFDASPPLEDDLDFTGASTLRVIVENP